jgi:hypothetical protein
MRISDEIRRVGMATTTRVEIARVVEDEKRRRRPRGGTEKARIMIICI